MLVCKSFVQETKNDKDFFKMISADAIQESVRIFARGYVVANDSQDPTNYKGIQERIQVWKEIKKLK